MANVEFLIQIEVERVEEEAEVTFIVFIVVNRDTMKIGIGTNIEDMSLVVNPVLLNFMLLIM